ncbi:hypothetical protein [Paenibacillus aquistagni]|uniref:hypothetical protein n=1 Tax=Paenibacillus aquistagni TaxID=1852522 RepID=UPI001132534A|nr:hypothetical protein [Paenibacillus aquistagni]
MIKQSGLDLQIKYKDEGYRLVWKQVKLDVEVWEQRVHQAPPVSTIRWKKTYSEELDVAPSQEVSDWYGKWREQTVSI